jgi:hypothetical protein
MLAVIPLALLAGNNPKRAVAVRTMDAPRIDGRLDEPVWQLAKPETEFWQQNPAEGEPATQRTEVRFLYDGEALYVSCMMYDRDPSKIVARLARRDDEVVADWISIRIDSYHDQQTAFEFTVNAAGVKTDIIQFSDGADEDDSWDAVWDVETAITGQGWIAEYKIPFQALRFSGDDTKEWGLQIIRNIARDSEVQHWALIRRSESGWVSRFGHLTGIENIAPPSGVQIIPYGVGSGRFLPKSPAHPDGREFATDAGFDLKYQHGSGLTIDATFNPDFGQVEADPAELNLSTFETFYPEKRPFFVEGSQIIRFTTFGGPTGPGLFYSRRIGRALSIDPPQGGYVEREPRFATILGAAKISGKTASGLSIGVLEAVTREETAILVDPLGVKREAVVEPLANYSLVRLRQDFSGNSNVGMMLTSVNREGRLPAWTTGVDWNLKFQESMYRMDGFWAGSRTTGFNDQRMDGSAGKINFSKDGGEHWRGYLSFDYTSKRYNINDIGFFRRPNDYGWQAQLLYRDDEVTDLKRIYNVSSSWHLRRNFDGAELIHSVDLEGYVLFPSYWELGVEAQINEGKHDDRETRGRGLYHKPATRNLNLFLETDSREHVVAELGLELGRDIRNGRWFGAGFELELKPASNLTLQFELEHIRRSNIFAWVANLDANSETSVFAERTTSEWDLTSRGSHVFTRDLTLQWYLQIFFAKGKFEQYRFYYRDGREGLVDPALVQPNQNFNRVSLNSNLVLRWEYLPGSTVYLVWSQARSGEHGLYSTSFGDDFRDTFQLPLENVLLLKVSYWMSL